MWGYLGYLGREEKKKRGQSIRKKKKKRRAKGSALNFFRFQWNFYQRRFLGLGSNFGSLNNGRIACSPMITAFTQGTRAFQHLNIQFYFFFKQSRGMTNSLPKFNPLPKLCCGCPHLIPATQWPAKVSGICCLISRKEKTNKHFLRNFPKVSNIKKTLILFFGTLWVSLYTHLGVF